MVLLGELVQHALDTAGARQWTPSGVKGAGMDLKRERLVCWSPAISCYGLGVFYLEIMVKDLEKIFNGVGNE